MKRKKEPLYVRIVRQALPILIVCAVIEIIAGLVLQNIEDYLSILPGLLVLVPGVMGMRGNLTGIFGSRLTSALHLGTMLPRFRENILLKENVKANLFMSIVSSVVIGIIAHFACIIFGFTSMGIIKFILIPMIAGFLSDIFIMVLTSSIAFLSFRKGHDPDNILMPSATSISDVFSILALFLTVKVFMLFS